MAKVSDIMTPYIECVALETTIQDASETMKTRDVGSLLVCNHDRFVGFLTDRDITVRASAQGRDPAATTVQEILTPRVVTCFLDQSIEEAAELMQRNQIRRLVVVDRQDRLVGIVSLGDLALRQDDKEVTTAILESVSTCTS